MKKILAFAALIALASCEKVRNVATMPDQNRYIDDNQAHYSVETIDSCEYLIVRSTDTHSGICVIHKANCKNHGAR